MVWTTYTDVSVASSYDLLMLAAPSAFPNFFWLQFFTTTGRVHTRVSHCVTGQCVTICHALTIVRCHHPAAAAGQSPRQNLCVDNHFAAPKTQQYFPELLELPK